MRNEIPYNDILSKKPKLHKETYWYETAKNKFYLKNSCFNSHLMVSEYVIKFLKLANGNNTISQICEQADISTNSQNIKDVYHLYYKELYKAGVLEEEEVKISKKESYIKLSFTILTEKHVTFLSRYLKFLFLKKNVAISLLSSFCILFIGIYLWHKQSITLFENSNSVLVCILLIFVFLIHELGHSTALYSFGEIPRKIGIGLFLFTPVLFADVSNSWKLNRKKRMIVDVGGLYLQFIVSCFYIFIFIISGNISFMLATFFSFLIGIINLNPFIKMDGYWLISDFMNVLNLKLIAKRKTLFLINSIRKRKNPSFNKKDIAYVLYFLINLFFIIGFVFYVLLWNFELFLNLPHSIANIISQILKGDFSELNIIEIESIILPFIILFLISNMIIQALMKKVL